MKHAPSFQQSIHPSDGTPLTPLGAKFFQGLETDDGFSNVWKTRLPRRVDARRPPENATLEKPSVSGSGGGLGGVAE
jgi:hypothetical protein